MVLFNHMTVRRRLTIGFGGLVALVLALALSSLAYITAMSSTIAFQDQVKHKLDPLYVAREALDQTGIAARNAFVLGDDAAARRELGIVERERTLYLAQLDVLTPQFLNNPQFDKVKNGLLAMAHELDRPRAYRAASDMRGYAKFLVDECSPLRRRIVTDIDILLKTEQKEAGDAAQAAQMTAAHAKNMVAMLTALVVTLCIAIGWGITRSLLRQLGGEPAYAANIADRIAHGELAVEVQLGAGDETSLLYSIRLMRDKLAAIVGQVRSGTDSIATASSQIASGNRDLSIRTEHQASALEEVASAMEELTSTVRQNADNAAQANQLAQSASAVSREGGKVVLEVVHTMDAINAASQKIVDIISVIDGIAFQTNILALNAAVEAARAGEQGRGFAVVASEVRVLAQRSASAAKEIKLLISDSVVKVDAGAKLVERAGDTMRNVVDSVGRVTDIMAEISSASREQSAGIEQVNNSIGNIDGMTQQNTALVEEATAAASEMQQQAAALVDVVSVFTLSVQAPRLAVASPTLSARVALLV